MTVCCSMVRLLRTIICRRANVCGPSGVAQHVSVVVPGIAAKQNPNALGEGTRRDRMVKFIYRQLIELLWRAVIQQTFQIRNGNVGRTVWSLFLSCIVFSALHGRC